MNKKKKSCPFCFFMCLCFIIFVLLLLFYLKDEKDKKEARYTTTFLCSSYSQPISTKNGIVNDDRVPHPEKIVQSDTNVSRQYTWKSYNDAYTLSIDFSLNEGIYNYYHSLGRYYSKDYKMYFKDSVNNDFVAKLSDSLNNLYDKMNYTDYEKVVETINFVQNITYTADNVATGINEWPKYPYETIYEECGDCEDTSILTAALIKAQGYGVVLIDFPGHCAIGVKCSDEFDGAYYMHKGNKYYYLETTSPNWLLGEIPDSFKGKPATIIDIT
jgi:hypothetical protein